MCLSLFCFVLNGQIKISTNSWFLEVDQSERYVIYFQSDMDDPDEFPEGRLVIYDIENESYSKLSSQTYILDFLVSKVGEDGTLLISNGSSIQQFSLPSGEMKEIVKVKEDCLIYDFEIGNSQESLFYSVVEQNSGEYKVLMDSKNGQTELYQQNWAKGSGEKLGIELEVDGNVAFLKNLDNELISVNTDNKEVINVDQDIRALFSIEKGFLYYAKRNALIEYNLRSNKKLEILQGESLRFSFLESYDKGLFISFNDNVFVYNKEKQTMKNMESLPKAKYVYFSESLAVSVVDKSIYVVRNSN